jgi:hypothetical protein
LYGQADAAPVWASEVVYQKLIGHPVEGITIPDAQNTTQLTSLQNRKTHRMRRLQMTF